MNKVYNSYSSKDTNYLINIKTSNKMYDIMNTIYRYKYRMPVLIDLIVNISNNMDPTVAIEQYPAPIIAK